MNKFFHLSTSRNAEAIVASSDDRAKQPDVFFSPRQPRDHSDEKPDPRICIAPNVWQCLISSPEPETPLFIYGLWCCGAKQARKDEHNVGDAEVTHEHWITDDVIAHNGGHIQLVCEGILSETIRPTLLIQDWVNNPRNAAMDPSSLDEKEDIWIIDSERVPREWRLRPSFGEEKQDDSPLPLPRMRF